MRLRSESDGPRVYGRAQYVRDRYSPKDKYSKPQCVDMSRGIRVQYYAPRC